MVGESSAAMRDVKGIAAHAAAALSNACTIDTAGAITSECGLSAA